MDFRPTVDYAVTVMTHIVVIGYNPEMADMSNPNGERYGEVGFVCVELVNGRRFANYQSMIDMDELYMFRQEVEDYLNDCGTLPSTQWTEIEPAYGSEAYVNGNVEFERWLEEQRDNRMAA